MSREKLLKAVRKHFNSIDVHPKLYSDKLFKKESSGIKVVNKESTYGMDGRIIKYIYGHIFMIEPKEFEEISKIVHEETDGEYVVVSMDPPGSCRFFGDELRIVHKDCPLAK